MPIFKKSSYNRPWYLSGAHLETIIPSLFYTIEGVNYSRERCELPDGDFLDLDWLKNGNQRLIILSHGLEGSSDRNYMKRPAKYFSKQGWDVLAWNCRGCSGEINRLPKTYHHGFIDDLAFVIDKAIGIGYKEVVLIGFSMGGNFTLKYLGVKGTELSKIVKGAVVFSVPCHLEDSSAEINKRRNRFYERRFLRKLKDKIQAKEEKHPELKADWKTIRNFSDFNRTFTLPIYGFKSEQEFYDQARSDWFLPSITVPTLLVNALNDPMLGPMNYPYEFAKQAENVWLETPSKGGHVGFTLANNPYSWMEYRANEFISEHL